jgi:hypothetical protein
MPTITLEKTKTTKSYIVFSSSKPGKHIITAYLDPKEYGDLEEVDIELPDTSEQKATKIKSKKKSKFRKTED